MRCRGSYQYAKMHPCTNVVVIWKVQQLAGRGPDPLQLNSNHFAMIVVQSLYGASTLFVLDLSLSGYVG